ncbi:MAG: 5-formyltetrahydrofolate cyclo-ligase, partial [Lachnospiraceae bacterium]|nr:5-formyltetrahydrofolate cyclo-ligase [Lachnospiraceae bacterium]
KERHRCGYGGGFYDRFLSVHTGMPTIAPAFEFQIVEEVPKDAFDIAPQTVVTESRIFHMIK